MLGAARLHSTAWNKEWTKKTHFL